MIRIAVAVANTACAAFWLFWVKPSWVKVAADAYALRLLEVRSRVESNIVVVVISFACLSRGCSRD